MPRLPRVSLTGILYYVTCRAPVNQSLFKDEADYVSFIDLLKGAKESKDFRVFAFSLLPNHVHLLLELGPAGNISEIMQGMNNAYTKYFNSKYDRKGSVFRGRFRTTYVEKLPHLLEVTRHVHLNARKLKIEDELGSYRFSSCGAYLGLASLPAGVGGLDMTREFAEVMELLGGDEGPEGYRDYLETSDKVRAGELHKSFNRGGFLGSDEFIEEVRQEIKKQSVPSGNGVAGPVRKTAVSVRVPYTRTGVGLRIATWAAIVTILVLAGSVIYLQVSRGAMEEKIREEMKVEFTDKRWKEFVARHDRETKENGNSGVRTVSLAGPRNLDGSVWTVDVKRNSAKDANPMYVDRLSFREGKITSRRLGSQGYPTSNYSVSRPDHETMVWETIQTRKQGDYVWFRGDVRGQSMRGVLITKRPGGKSETLYFVSKGVPEFPL